jgi:hypothetical protein
VVTTSPTVDNRAFGSIRNTVSGSTVCRSARSRDSRKPRQPFLQVCRSPAQLVWQLSSPQLNRQRSPLRETKKGQEPRSIFSFTTPPDGANRSTPLTRGSRLNYVNHAAVSAHGILHRLLKKRSNYKTTSVHGPPPATVCCGIGSLLHRDGINIVTGSLKH